MNLQPTLENELLILRPLLNSDFENLYAVAKDPKIWEQHPVHDRYTRAVYTEFFEDSICSKGAMVIIEKSSNTIIGSSRFKPIDNSETAIEIGWTFLQRNKWGGPYNKAAKNLMIDYAFTHLDSIIFYIGIHNIRSQKAVEKLGASLISDDTFRHLIKPSKEDLSYIIKKEVWQSR